MISARTFLLPYVPVIVCMDFSMLSFLNFLMLNFVLINGAEVQNIWMIWMIM